MCVCVCEINGVFRQAHVCVDPGHVATCQTGSVSSPCHMTSDRHVTWPPALSVPWGKQWLTREMPAMQSFTKTPAYLHDTLKWALLYLKEPQNTINLINDQYICHRTYFSLVTLTWMQLLIVFMSAQVCY